jgi:hypothetical protein
LKEHDADASEEVHDCYACFAEPAPAPLGEREHEAQAQMDRHRRHRRAPQKRLEQEVGDQERPDHDHRDGEGFRREVHGVSMFGLTELRLM